MVHEAQGKNAKHEAYIDLAKPLASEIGEVAGELVTRVLQPVRFAIWTWDQIAAELGPMLKESLSRIPPDQLQPPPANIAIPAVMKLEYTGHEPPLHEMFAHLLASSMDARRARDAHPAFVAILAEMTPDEGRIMTILKPAFSVPLTLQISLTSRAGCTSHTSIGYPLLPELAGLSTNRNFESNLLNLSRVGLVAVSHESEPFEDIIVEGADLVALRNKVEAACAANNVRLTQGIVTAYERMFSRDFALPRHSSNVVLSFSGRVRLTAFGDLFHSACVLGPQT